MAAKKDTKDAKAKKPKGGKKGSGILDKVKDIVGEVLSGAAQGAAATALNIGAEAVGGMLEGGDAGTTGSADKTTKAKAASGGSSTKGGGSAGKTSAKKPSGDAGTKGTGSAGKTTKSAAKTAAKPGGDAGTTGSAGKTTKAKTTKSGGTASKTGGDAGTKGMGSAGKSSGGGDKGSAKKSK